MSAKWTNSEQQCQKARTLKQMPNVLNSNDKDDDGLHAQEMHVQVALECIGLFHFHLQVFFFFFCKINDC